MTRLVYATESTRLTDKDGLSYPVVANQPWDADDPLVRRNPQFFTDQPTQVMRTLIPVEQATHAPGEMRRRVG